jgi:hypothetical protein
MNLYLLKRTAPIGYDETASIVVRAASEEDARRTAAEQCGDEGEEPWLSGLDVEPVTCELLTTDDAPGVICRDFHGG